MSSAAVSLDSPALLTLILDLSPLAWHDASAPSLTASPDGQPESLTLQAMLVQVLIFMNAHLAATAGNRLAVWGVKGRKSVLLYSSSEAPERERKPDPNTYEPFRVVGDAVGRRLEAFMTEEEEGDAKSGLAEYTSLVTALAKALCYINRMGQSSSPVSTTVAHAVSASGASAQGTSQSGKSGTNARILVISAGEEQSEGYVSLMNCIFSAQKARIMIDVCKVSGGDAIFLQQAAHLTGGIFLRTQQHRSSLLQYLMTTFLPPRQMRQLILMPSQERVDFRAACFCHKRIIDVGYVCSVCLSIFCKPTPVCSTCKTRFPLKTLQALGAGMPKPAGGARKSRPVSRGASPALARVAAGSGSGALATGSPLASNEPIVIDDD